MVFTIVEKNLHKEARVMNVSLVRFGDLFLFDVSWPDMR